MKNPNSQNRHHQHASALVVVMVFLAVMAGCIAAVYEYTNGVRHSTATNGQFLQANAAAEAAVETVIGRLIQWVNSNNGYGPSIGDCATSGVPGNPTFPAINSAITFPSSSKLSSYNVSTPLVYPVLPDDTVVTNTGDSKYLPNLSARINVSENSNSSVTKYYFTRSATLNAKNVASRSITYKITVTVTPKVATLGSATPFTLVRYLRCDKISPFGWCTYRMGSATYSSAVTYTGPMYIAGIVTFNGSTFTDNVLYTGTATNNNGTFTGGGYVQQVSQTPLLSLIPGLVNDLAVNSSGNRQASFETNTTIGGAASPSTTDPADTFSTRELIEPPNNPASDTTPSDIQNARIYNQADARIKVVVTTVGPIKTVAKSVVDVYGNTVIPNPITAPWVTPLLNAVNVKTSTDAVPFYDRSRSTSTPIESTDIDVGALKTVMQTYPSAFPTGIIYAWDATGLPGAPFGATTRPLTGVRLWDAGVLPSGGLVVGSNDPVYIRGDFNTGTTLPGGATVNSSPINGPPSNSLGYNNNATTESQREISGYTIQPAGVFGDAVIELSNAWNDANSKNSTSATSTTINLVEGWSTNSANELRPDDTYLDVANHSCPIWIENWSSARRTMSGEEMVAWHSRYSTTTNLYTGGGWAGDISYDAKATALKLNWGTVNFVRDRSRRQ